MREFLLTATLVASCLLATGVSRADVLVVDAGDAAAYPEIQAAVDAALEGDTIWIRDGSYASFDVVGKSLDLIGVGDQVRIGIDANGLVTTPTRIIGIGASQHLTLRNVTIGRLGVGGCSGQVWMESVGLARSVVLSPDLAYFEIFDSGAVVLVDVKTLPLLPGVWFQLRPAIAVQSSVYAFGCCFLAILPTFYPGVPAVVGFGLQGSSLFASACRFAGGQGGSSTTGGFGGGCFPGLNGGSAISLDSTSEMQHRDCSFQPGPPGLDQLGCGTGGVPAPIDAAPGSVVSSLFGIQRYGRANAVSLAGKTSPVDLLGSPQDFVFLLQTVDPVRVSITSPYVGQLFFAPGFGLLNAGALDAKGLGSFDWTAPVLPPGVAARAVTLQPIFVDAFLGLLSLGAPTRTVVTAQLP